MIQQQPVTLLFTTSCPSNGQLLMVSPLLDDSMFRRGITEKVNMNKIAYRTSYWGTQRRFNRYIEAKPLGQSFPCAVTGHLTHLRRGEKEEGQRQGREGKKRANMLAAAAAHLLVEGDMVTCGYLWMIGGCMMTVWCIKIFGYLTSAKMKFIVATPMWTNHWIPEIHLHQSPRSGCFVASL